MKVSDKIITKSNYKVITSVRLIRFGLAVLLIIWAISAILTAGGCASQADSAEIGGPKDNTPVAELISRADQLFKKRDDLKNLREAVSLLKRTRQAERKNYEAAWKLSRLYYYLGKYSKDEKEIEQSSKDGIEFAKVATRIETEKPEGYFWLGANLGENARRNPFTGLTLIGEIREAMNKVIALEPGCEGASAYDVLAQIEMQTDVYGGSAQKAVEYLEQAVAIEKNNSNLYLHLGEAYLMTDRDEEGKKQLETVLKRRPDPDHLFEHGEAVKEAEKVLQNRF